jgi:hypothetical protein
MSILPFSEADLQNFGQNRPPEKEQKRDPQVAQNTRVHSRGDNGIGKETSFTSFFSH